MLSSYAVNIMLSSYAVIIMLSSYAVIIMLSSYAVIIMLSSYAVIIMLSSYAVIIIITMPLLLLNRFEQEQASCKKWIEPKKLTNQKPKLKVYHREKYFEFLYVYLFILLKFLSCYISFCARLYES